MFPVMRIVGVDHAVQISVFLFWPPPDALVYDDVVKDEVKDPVTEDAYGHRKPIRVIGYERGIIKKKDRRNTEDHGKPIIFFQRVVVDCMVGFVPNPEHTVHNILMSKPG